MKRSQPSPASCNGCGAEQPSLLLHNVRYRAHHRRFCTNCVLKNHQGLFCPICFDVYDDSPPPHLRLMCLKCPSIAHRSCVVAATTTTNSNAPSSSPVSFQCPPCTDPKFSYFKVNSNEPSLNKPTNGGENGGPVAIPAQNAPNSRAIDIESAKVLVAAARIAAASMCKAAAAARIDAERRAKEAALARKKAREALEHVAYIVAKERDAKGASTDQRAFLAKMPASM
ncbi:hypothetical protein L6164_011892 [Bauhinia variegata]|uniref:Uncharacterized protein n=1 Tax=Bauhinia variegata TaxID=167791 RepID=A0ACB9P9X7_BAUVA|nr:hypothetical protein L6164_011892 [Bauhinia variegata]